MLICPEPFFDIEFLEPLAFLPYDDIWGVILLL